MCRTFASQEEALRILVESMLMPGAPDLIEARDWRQPS
jgi:hypothetical protein